MSNSRFQFANRSVAVAAMLLCTAIILPQTSWGQDVDVQGRVSEVRNDSTVVIEVSEGYQVGDNANGEIYDMRGGDEFPIAHIAVETGGTGSVVARVTGMSGTVPVGEGAFARFDIFEPAGASIEIVSRPPALVYVDGEQIGWTPASVDVEPGTRRIRAVRQGHVTKEATVELSPGDSERVSLVLEQRMADLNITTRPTNARIFIDGEFAGESPLSVVKPVKTYEVRAEKDGYATELDTIQVVERMGDIELELQPNPVLYVVNSDPSGARIFVNSGFHGTTPDTLSLTPGTYNMAIEKVGYDAWEQEIELTRSSGSLTARLSPTPIPFMVRSTPSGATIRVDGQSVGQTPRTVELTIGEYSLQVEKSGYRVWEDRINVRSEMADLDITLDESPGILIINSDPDGAKVLINGELVGETLFVADDLSIGTHQVRIELEGYSAVEEAVELRGGASNATTIDVELEPEVSEGLSLAELMEQGDALRLRGACEEAAIYFKAALRMNPDFQRAQDKLEMAELCPDISAWKLAAEEYVELGRYDEAKPYVDDLLMVNPKDSDALRWNRKIDNRNRQYAGKPSISLRRDRNTFQEISVVSDIAKTPSGLRVANEMKGVTLQIWTASPAGWLRGFQFSAFQSESSLVDARGLPTYSITDGDTLALPIALENAFVADVKLGGYPIRTEWGNIGLFTGVGMTLVKAKDQAWSPKVAVPVGITFQVFPFRRLVVPTMLPDLPLARIGFEITSSYRWSDTLAYEDESGTEEIELSRKEFGFGIILRF